MDFAAAGLLDGLEGNDRKQRLDYLESLEEAGFTLEEMVAAASENRLALLPVDRALRGRYTAEEVQDHAGVPASMVLRSRRLLGLAEAGPDDPVFTDEDIAAVHALQQFLEVGFSEKAIDEMTRVLGEAMARVSGATTGAFAEAFLKPGDTERDVAWRFGEMSKQLLGALDPVLVAAYRAHLRDWVRVGMLGRRELTTGQIAAALDLGVCFADLVGFTRLGGELQAGELDEVVSEFGRLANEVAGQRVRLIKTIGDAAMFSSAEPQRLVAASLDLVDAIEQAELPTVRVGVAFGTTIPRSGDLYGPAVNLASRVTGVARPGSVLCTEEVRELAPDEFDWSYAGRHRMKGIGDSVPLYRARRAGATEPRARR